MVRESLTQPSPRTARSFKRRCGCHRQQEQAESGHEGPGGHAATSRSGRSGSAIGAGWSCPAGKNFKKARNVFDALAGIFRVKVPLVRLARMPRLLRNQIDGLTRRQQPHRAHPHLVVRSA